MARWFSPILAFSLSFIIIATLAPVLGLQTERQYDFWLLWFVAMLFLALPMTYLEVALAKRSQTTALAALASLTRDADASPKWRLVGWLAVAFIPFLAGSLLNHSAQLLVAQTQLGIAPIFLFAGLAIVSFILSFLPRSILLGLSAAGVLISWILAQSMGGTATAWHWTAIQFQEWGGAVVLAMIASGLGMGLYWQNSLSNHSAQTTPISLPIWLAQLLAVLAFAFFATTTTIPALLLVIVGVTVSAVLLQLGREQLQQRQTALLMSWLLQIVAVAVWLIPVTQTLLNDLLMLWGLLITLIYAVFAGWIMKISHLRKALNFSNELIYNLWRIAMRVILPVSIVLAIVALAGRFIV